MEPVPDYYAILGVAPTATAEEIRRAHRRLARTNHPDRNGGEAASVERMKTINAARDLLSDPAQRLAYDAQRAEIMRLRDAARHHDGRRVHQEPQRPGPVFSHHGSRHHARRGHRIKARWIVAAIALAGWTIAFASVESNETAHRSRRYPYAAPAAITLPGSASDPNLVQDAHPEICEAFQQYSGVLWAGTGADETSINIAMNEETTASDRIAAAHQAVAYMDARVRQGIDDHVTEIRVIPDQSSEPPIIVLPSRQAWSIRVPSQRREKASARKS